MEARPAQAVLLEPSVPRRATFSSLLEDVDPPVLLEAVDDRAGLIRALATRRCDVVLLGPSLASTAVHEALEQAKHHAPDLPVIVLADPLDEEAAVEAFHRGASDYVVMTRPERLVRAIGRALHDRDERAGRRRAGEALAFTARTSAELAGSLDFNTTVERVARLAVPFLGGYCAVEVLEDGRVRRRSEHALEDFPPGLLKALRGLTASPENTFWAGRPQALPVLAGTDPPPEEALRPLLQEGIASLLRLPLRAQGGALGLLTLAVARPHPPQNAGLSLAEDFAHRASLALDAARAHQELQRSDQRKDEFLAMLAHELRNPLASILAGLELVKVRGDGPPVEGPLSMAERQAKHMARILDDLLDISRITRGKIELRRQPVELNALVQAAVQGSRARIEARGLTLTLELSPEPLPAFADPDRIEQVLANLMGNGGKFTRAGGALWVSTAREGQSAVLRVRDSGIGIEPEMLPRVFDLFVQANPALDRTEGGLGLGLTLVRKLAELHGGNVVVRSEGRGRGSEFTVLLPLSPGLHVTARVAPAVVPKAPAHLRVLLVDDNEDLRESTSELLRILDHEVVEAADGHEAVRRAEAEAFDVALLDLGLPGLNGYAVAQTLRTLEEGSGHRTALVALTGYGQPEHRRRTLQAGFDEHLTKPLDFEQLRSVLARLAPRSTMERGSPSV